MLGVEDFINETIEELKANGKLAAYTSGAGTVVGVALQAGVADELVEFAPMAPEVRAA